MREKYFNLMKKLFELQKTTKNFEGIVSKSRLVSAEEGKISVEFEVEERMTNHLGTLHGGCSATLVDILTTAALMSTPKGLPGVSVDLHVTYLAAAKVGDTVQCDAEVIRNGKSLAFTKATLFRQHDKTLVATGLHTKAFPAHAHRKIE